MKRKSAAGGNSNEPLYRLSKSYVGDIDDAGRWEIAADILCAQLELPGNVLLLS